MSTTRARYSEILNPGREAVTPRYGRAIRDYYEDLWERLPAELEPPSIRAPAALPAGRRCAPGDRALDVGCGAGDFTAVLARRGRERSGVEVARGGGRAGARPASRRSTFGWSPIDGPLPLEDGSFDLVWASEVIEHVADTARWLSEVRRVLAPGGRLLVTTPSHGRLRVALGGVERFSEPLGDHLHLYTRRSLATPCRRVRLRRDSSACGGGAAAAQADAAGPRGALGRSSWSGGGHVVVRSRGRAPRTAARPRAAPGRSAGRSRPN